MSQERLDRFFRRLLTMVNGNVVERRMTRRRARL